MHFDCCDEDAFIARLDSEGLKDIIIHTFILEE